ncbi:hypothetical protein HZB90_04980 [archaeon]|nr:hypothetical protein [archaeon]
MPKKATKAKEKTEKLVLTVKKVVRKTNGVTIADDLKEGYIYFDIHFDANGRNLVVEKRTRLDKPERMLEKFVSKIVAQVEEKYKDMKYFVARKTPPEIITKLTNEKALKEAMMDLFKEVDKYTKTKNVSVLVTKQVEL